MSDEHFSLFDDGRTSQRMVLVGEVTVLMLKGAGYAAIFCLVMWFALAAMAWVGQLLPEESQQADDPTPWSSLEIVAPEAVT